MVMSAEGMTVNVGAKNGIVAIPQQDDMPWLIHCMNHRWQLGKKSYMNCLYYVHQESHK